ncbi:MAG TPA: hypothetical protein VFK73_04135, partial [Paludibacter sp.]|nr:hypothetical protein [Paludibacter sp.]
FGNNRKIIVNLATAKKNDGTAFNPSHVYIAGFWSTGANPFIIDKVYLAKTDAELTAIKEISDVDKNEKVDVYSTTGILLRSQVERETATHKLPNGIYVIGNNKGFVKTLYNQQSVK